MGRREKIKNKKPIRQKEVQGIGESQHGWEFESKRQKVKGSESCLKVEI